MKKKTKTAKSGSIKHQLRTDLDLAIQVSDRVELDSVRLLKCDCQQIRLVGACQKSFEIERKTDSVVDKGTSRIFVSVHFVLKAKEGGTTHEGPFAIIKATFLLIYKADSIEGITSKAVEHFGNINGIYNAWPYWREYVQNTIVRMGLPTLTIPVFRIVAPPKAKKAKKKVISKKKAAKKKTKKA